jgi:eukaryotic-like serine/threonine-protein kinase
MIGELVGQYRIVRELGAGGMGVVYLGKHEVIGRLAAIKLLLAQACQNDEVVTRFFNEARTTASLKHPGLVDVYDFGRLPDGRGYMVMEYLEGQPLSKLLELQGRLGLDLAIGLVRQIAGAVGAAHAKGIVHRDLKPDNVFIVRDDDVEFGVRARVLDFGVAKLAPELGAVELHTRTGSILGTPVYMAPEQCRGAGTVDWRTDIYALGCIFFEMVTGRRVFPYEGVGEVIGAHLHTPPQRPSEIATGVPGWLDKVILKALAKSPGDRWQSMDELAGALGGKRRPTAPPSIDSTAIIAGATPAPSTFSRTYGEVVGARKVGRRAALVGSVLAAAAAAAVVALVAHGPATPPPPEIRPAAAVAPAPPPPPAPAAAPPVAPAPIPVAAPAAAPVVPRPAPADMLPLGPVAAAVVAGLADAPAPPALEAAPKPATAPAAATAKPAPAKTPRPRPTKQAAPRETLDPF